MLKYAFFMLLACVQGCFHAAGPKLLWRAPVASDLPPLVQNGAIYVQGFHAGHPEEPQRLFALDAATGKENWLSADSVKEVYGASGGYVFFKNTAGHLVQLEARTGEKIHESDAAGPGIVNWAIRGDTMFIINTAFEVAAVDNRQNKVLWRMKLPFQPGDETDLQLTGQHVVASGNFRQGKGVFGMVWVLDAETGREFWHFEAPPPHDYAPLKIVTHGSYVLATNTSPLVLLTHVLDAHTGRELYPPMAAFDLYGCYRDTAYAPSGAFDLRTGQRSGGAAGWVSGSVVYEGIAWKRRLGQVGPSKALALRSTYDGDCRGARYWLDAPPNSSLEGIDLSSAKALYHTKEYRYTRFSTPVEAEGLLFHTSIAVMKEGESGVWAYRLPGRS